ncbi:hypothetical protein N7510_010484 [Penicillium lagena]|uniref:uncharacterized protein n=1 Tax=Penicillium lagena TaxID=94218 RepID=UPI00253FD60D|nr:uncharacterized protein N7510_010484 [Penicillium lagena]KAJ5605330.1 hypothetical protein N7510_010484 [Penicillium lagena]
MPPGAAARPRVPPPWTGPPVVRAPRGSIHAADTLAVIPHIIRDRARATPYANEDRSPRLTLLYVEIARPPREMDLFTFYEPLRVWICRPCEMGVNPHWIEGHLRDHHKAHPTARTHALRREARAAAWDRRPWDPAREPFATPAPTHPPIPGIPTHRGYGCPEPGCESVAATGLDTIRKHRRAVHGRAPPRPRVFTNVKGAATFFVVTPVEPRRRTWAELNLTPADTMRVEVNRAIERASALVEADDQLAPIDRETGADKTTPWLRRTRWPEIIGGHSFTAIAGLAAGPDPITEPVLIAIASSVRRISKAALDSLHSNRINEFDQVRINTFRRRGEGIWNRPIHIHLQPTTFRRYQGVWVRLISFVYRTSRPSQPIKLRHQLTNRQLAALDRLEEHTRLIILREREASREPLQPYIDAETRIDPQLEADITGLHDQLDRACLELSIALLDHELNGDIYESAVVGFLAALGVDAENQTYRDPSNYTPFLSAMVKMAQLLVAQQAIQLVDDGQVAYPGEVLDEMRERFLAFGVRAPFHWITRLRALNFREVHLTMSGLRRFVQTQVELAQWDLEQLFLLREDEDSSSETHKGIIPTLPLSQLTDDPINNSRGWNFLSDPRNRAVLPTTGERWLLDRVLASDTLRDEFISVRRSDSQVGFQKAAVDAYREMVDRFLQRLLLAIHLTGGQPARATEVISLWHRNTPEGRHRNLFIENGLIAVVTAYHKAQNVTNSIRIIHCYLPQELSAILVYYLWLVLPFLEHATMLAAEIPQPLKRSPFLWPRGSSHWPPDSLGVILQGMIGISRMHLASGRFKQDYRLEQNIADEQAAHTSWVAGTTYARMI